MQEIDAERRLAILRGEEPPPLPPSPERSAAPAVDLAVGSGRPATERRKRKRPGEDDTDFEMRIARERAACLGAGSGGARLEGPSAGSAGAAGTLLDEKGHISLFGPPSTTTDVTRARSSARGDKHGEADCEAAKKRREYEDQYTVRLANAAGRDGLGLTDKGPWYAKSGRGDSENWGVEGMPSKDVWGNEDPRRRVREAARLQANDPLALMKKAAAKVREIDSERKREAEERERELRQLRKEERRREKRRRRREEESRHAGPSDDDDLEGFSLDAPADPLQGDTRCHRTHHRSHRSRSRRRRSDEERHGKPGESEDRQHRHRDHRHRHHHH
ncbi:hypothetical protein VTK73DRAFT_8495 [Phialemonium thermophilum]|uniref:CBF1-interacting co-repressor CIR N-terminal domain-containing protein n=1 Tax=Phialemonium thermophilum TaxID=223376 RepID=A0ABR3XPF2_9PEZI